MQFLFRLLGIACGWDFLGVPQSYASASEPVRVT